MNKKGFTLIELLVVVLIIGILSSVALPQYTKAVSRARATEALMAGKALADAQNVYYAEHERYVTMGGNWKEQLDVEIPSMKYFTLGSGTTSVHECAGQSCGFKLESKTKDAALSFNLRNGKVEDRFCIGCDCMELFRVGSGTIIK